METALSIYNAVDVGAHDCMMKVITVEASKEPQTIDGIVSAKYNASAFF
jgi:hypothetical protein